MGILFYGNMGIWETINMVLWFYGFMGILFYGFIVINKIIILWILYISIHIGGFTTTALPIEHTSSKITRYGVEKRLIQLLKYNYSHREVADALTLLLNDPEKQINKEDVMNWLMAQSQELQNSIVEEQYRRLSKLVWNRERRGIKLRDKALDQIQQLIESLKDDMDKMSPKDKKDMSNIIMKQIYIQESFEKMAGLGSGRRNYGDINVNVQVDVIDRLKELNKSKKKNKVIDAEYEDVGKK